MSKNKRYREKDTLDKSTVKWARFADTSYAAERNRRQRLKNVTKRNKDWLYDDDLSSEHHAVFVNKKTKEVVTSFRGTKTDDLSDIAADLLIASGKFSHSPRVVESQKIFGDIVEKYPSDAWDHILSSHSLGGSLNMEVYKQYKDDIREVHNYNRGSGPEALLTGILGTGFDSKVTDHIVEGDPISFAATFSTNTNLDIIQPREGSNAHSLDQFFY